MNLLVGLVDILNGEDSQTAVISQIAQSDLVAGLDAQLVDLLLVDIEGDGHGEEGAIGQTEVLDGAVFIMSEPNCIPSDTVVSLTYLSKSFWVMKPALRSLSAHRLSHTLD